MGTQTQLSDTTIPEQLRNEIQERTLLGSVGVTLFIAGGYVLGGFPAIIVGGVVLMLWLYGTTPLSIAFGSIGITGISEPATMSTVFGGTPTIFPSPVVGIGLLGAGIAGLSFESIVMAYRPTRVLRAASLLVVTGFTGLLAIAHLEEMPIYVITGVASGVVFFLTGVLARTVAVRTTSEEAPRE